MNSPPAKRREGPKDEPLDPATSFEAEIDRQIGDLVSQKARKEIVGRVTAVVVAEAFSGPIAHPRHLAEYERICPGAADRIIAMAEKRNDHHIAMEKRGLDAETSDQRVGMFSGFGLFAFLIVSALVTALTTDNSLLSGLFLGTATLGGVGLFIKGRNGN